MKKPYKIVSGASTPNRRELADWLAKDGQLLIPLVELLEKGERAIDEVIEVMGRATIEAVLRMSAEQVAGPKEQGRRDADRDLYWHGVQAGRVALKERQLRVDKPRLRKKRPRADEPGEVEIPAYTALQADQPLADRMLELVLQGVSTRKYEKVLPALADQVGVSKSEVSRETIEAGTRVLKELAERDLGKLDVLVVYLDGIVFGNYHVVAAVGVDADGRKHVLGLCGGASENTEVTAGLLEDLVARGLRADRRRLFVIDGAKALRQPIGRVFGSANLVQRCRNHKVRNVLGHLTGMLTRVVSSGPSPDARRSSQSTSSCWSRRTFEQAPPQRASSGSAVGRVERRGEASGACRGSATGSISLLWRPWSPVGCGVRGRPNAISSPGSLQRQPAAGTGMNRRRGWEALRKDDRAPQQRGSTVHPQRAECGGHVRPPAQGSNQRRI